MSKLHSTIVSCRERGTLCPGLPSIALSLGNDGPDLLITIGHLAIDADTGKAEVLSAEQVKCVRGVPRPELFREAGDPGPKWCEHCRAAYGYAVLGTVYAALANLLRPDLQLDFGKVQQTVDSPPPAA